jgi:hypothetical protein
VSSWAGRPATGRCSTSTAGSGAQEAGVLRREVQLQDEAEVAYSRFESVSVIRRRWRRSGSVWAPAGPVSPTRPAVPGRVGPARDDRHGPPALPTGILLLGPDLDVQQTWNGDWFWGRPTHAELRHSFRTVTMSSGAPRPQPRGRRRPPGVARREPGCGPRPRGDSWCRRTRPRPAAPRRPASCKDGPRWSPRRGGALHP